MTATHWEIFRSCGPLIGFALFVAVVFAWHEWEWRIAPLRTPKAAIDQIADDLIAKHGPQAEHVAFINEDYEWRDSNVFERGKWFRVRKELWRRYEAREWAGPEDAPRDDAG